MTVRHLAGIAEIVDDLTEASRFYREILGLEVREQGPGYATAAVPGVLHFGLWERSTAATAIFGDPGRADEVPLGFTVGFEVDAVSEACSQIEASGAAVLHAAKTEPWGQTTARWLSSSGALAEVSETPQARRLQRDLEAGE